MLYSFLNSDDLDSGIKEEQLTQLVRDNLGLIAVAESGSISWMQDYLGQRYDLAATFPTIGEWAASNDYAPAVAITLPAQADPGSGCFYDLSRNFSTQPTTYLPPYAYNPAGRLTNYAYHEETGLYYWATTASLGVEPGVTTGWEDYWQVRDPRNAKLVAFAVDITLFNLFKRVAPRRIPELRTSLYNQAKEWLTLVKDGNLTPDLPRPLKLVDSSDEIRWGSNRPQQHYY